MEIRQSSDRNNFAQFFLRHGVYVGIYVRLLCVCMCVCLCGRVCRGVCVRARALIVQLS